MLDKIFGVLLLLLGLATFLWNVSLFYNPFDPYGPFSTFSDLGSAGIFGLIVIVFDIVFIVVCIAFGLRLLGRKSRSD